MENINYNGLSERERERGAWMGASKISKQTPCMIHLFPFPLFHFFTNDLPYNFLVFILIFHLVSSNYPTRGKREWVRACYTKDNTKQTHTRRTSPLFSFSCFFLLSSFGFREAIVDPNEHANTKTIFLSRFAKHTHTAIAFLQSTITNTLTIHHRAQTSNQSNGFSVLLHHFRLLLIGENHARAHLPPRPLFAVTERIEYIQ